MTTGSTPLAYAGPCTQKKEGLVSDMKLKGSLGFSDHEMMEFKINRVSKRLCSKLATLDFRREPLQGIAWQR